MINVSEGELSERLILPNIFELMRPSKRHLEFVQHNYSSGELLYLKPRQMDMRRKWGHWDTQIISEN